LGLGWALNDRLLPLLVAAMTFLAALALAGFIAAAALGRHWQQGAEAVLTVQVPQPNAPAPASQTARPDVNRPTRLDRVLTVVRASPGVISARALSPDELASLLRPWLGPALGGMALPIPAVIDVHLDNTQDAGSDLAAQVDAAAPGALVESHGAWVRRLTVLANSLQACTGAALLVVTLVAVAVVSVATRAALAGRREAIEVVHGLGATDGYIAGCFARQALAQAGIGGVAGAMMALPLLLWLAALAAPFNGLQEGALSESGRGEGDVFAALPNALWEILPLLPITAAAIGWLIAQGTVRRWLHQLP
jgi:cell division transport system permease protein